VTAQRSTDPRLVKEVDGIAITLTDSGKFTAEIGGKTVTRGTLRDLVALVIHQRTPTPAIVAGSRGVSCTPQRIEVLEIDGDRFLTTDRRVAFDRYSRILVWDPAVFRRLQELHERYEVLQREWKDIVEGTPRLTRLGLEEEDADVR